MGDHIQEELDSSKTETKETVERQTVPSSPPLHYARLNCLNETSRGLSQIVQSEQQNDARRFLPESLLIHFRRDGEDDSDVEFVELEQNDMSETHLEESDILGGLPNTLSYLYDPVAATPDELPQRSELFESADEDEDMESVVQNIIDGAGSSEISDDDEDSNSSPEDGEHDGIGGGIFQRAPTSTINQSTETEPSPPGEDIQNETSHPRESHITIGVSAYSVSEGSDREDADIRASENAAEDPPDGNQQIITPSLTIPATSIGSSVGSMFMRTLRALQRRQLGDGQESGLSRIRIRRLFNQEQGRRGPDIPEDGNLLIARSLAAVQMRSEPK